VEYDGQCYICGGTFKYGYYPLGRLDCEHISGKCLVCGSQVCERPDCSISFWDIFDKTHRLCCPCRDRYRIPPTNYSESFLSALAALHQTGEKVDCPDCKGSFEPATVCSSFTHCPYCFRLVCPGCFLENPFSRLNPIPGGRDMCRQCFKQAGKAVKKIRKMYRPCAVCKTAILPQNKWRESDKAYTWAAGCALSPFPPRAGKCQFCDRYVCPSCARLVTHKNERKRQCSACAGK